ncbi:MAG: AAA family ATPase [Eggerthellaceae bacterium]|nr:AAA family ATPase [Eggerthellaceae bacterium]
MGASKQGYAAQMEEAAARVGEAEPGEVTATQGSGLPPFQDAIVVADELPQMPDEIIEGILLETHKMLLTGPSKANKTWGLIALAESVATGSSWLGFRCAMRRVLYVDFETDARTLQKRISTVAYAKGAKPEEVRKNLVVWPLRGKSCSLEEVAAELFARCRPGDFGMVVLDPAYMIQDGDENNARDIREFFAKLDSLCVGLGCTVVISHHHSKGAQGMKSAIDRSSGSGVFGRAPDAVLDMTELVLEPGTLQMARELHSLAATRHLTGWRISFTLREFPPKPPLDAWFVFPLHRVDDTGLLEDCKPNFGGASEARRLRLEAENVGKIASLDAVCERLIGDAGFVYRDEVERALGWSTSTVNRWLGKSTRFMRVSPEGGAKAKVVRRGGDADAG